MRIAELIVKDIMEELAGRSGSLLHNELDEEIVSDMRNTWIAIVMKHIAVLTNAKHPDGECQCVCPAGVGICGFGNPDTNICNYHRR